MVLFLCTFSVIQWIIVLFSYEHYSWIVHQLRFVLTLYYYLDICCINWNLQWIIVLFSYEHFQSFSEASSCFEEFHDDLLAFIIIIVWYIFRTSGIQCPVWRCYWRSTWSNNYCNDHLRDPILHERKQDDDSLNDWKCTSK
jgi:hypothetical protein